jgi:hypothetical protein
MFAKNLARPQACTSLTLFYREKFATLLCRKNIAKKSPGFPPKCPLNLRVKVEARIQDRSRYFLKLSGSVFYSAVRNSPFHFDSHDAKDSLRKTECSSLIKKNPPEVGRIK